MVDIKEKVISKVVSILYYCVVVIVICMRFVEHVRAIMYRAQALGMTGGDYVFLHFTIVLNSSRIQPWEDGTAMTSEQRAKRIDAYRPLKQVGVKHCFIVTQVNLKVD